MTTDWKALCTELADVLAEEYGVQREFDGGDPLLGSGAIELLSRVRTALAQSEPEGPTDEDLKAAYWEAFVEAAPCGADESWLAGLRAVARWGRPAVEPVPVSERPWGREGWCDAKGQCWMGDGGGNGFVPSWRLCNPSDSRPFPWSLPHYALPVPAPETNGQT